LRLSRTKITHYFDNGNVLESLSNDSRHLEDLLIFAPMLRVERRRFVSLTEVFSQEYLSTKAS
ncbi:MAG: hypothetical protein AAFW66_11430, partial [Pseudomonadota bacterium]